MYNASGSFVLHDKDNILGGFEFLRNCGGGCLQITGLEFNRKLRNDVTDKNKISAQTPSVNVRF